MSDSNFPVISVPEDLAFDDASVLPMEGLQHEPTPASALRLWLEKADRSASVAAAVAAIVTANPEYLQNHDIDDLETCLTQALHDASESERRSIQFARCSVAISRKDYALALSILDFLASENAPASDKNRLVELRIEILQALGKQEEADRLRRNFAIDELLDADVSSIDLRAQARALFLEGNNAEAERVYLHLLKRRFELDSTYCHLVRVCLMLNRVDDAFRYLDMAEQFCRERSYVQARIIFLHILKCYIDQKSTGNLLMKLRQTLSEPGAFEGWTMEPVIDHLKVRQKISASQSQILMNLIKVLGSVTNLPNLEIITSLDLPTLTNLK